MLKRTLRTLLRTLNWDNLQLKPQLKLGGHIVGLLFAETVDTSDYIYRTQFYQTYLLRRYSSLNRSNVSNFGRHFFNCKQSNALINPRLMLAITECTSIFLDMPKSASLTSPSLVNNTLAPISQKQEAITCVRATEW